MLPLSLLRLLRTSPLTLTLTLRTHPHPHLHPSTKPPLNRIFATPLPNLPPRRHYAAKTAADAAVEELQELYATAKDEFEIAQEETSKKSVYAAEDRAAAQEELAKLKEAYTLAVQEAGDEDEETGREIRRRVGQRVRELERGVEAMEERAMED